MSGPQSRRAVLLGAAGTLGIGAAALRLHEPSRQAPRPLATTTPTSAAPASPVPAASAADVTVLVRPAVRFGVNYTPSKHWWYLWQQWDPARVNADLAQIAALGVDHIRIQLMWDVFQPAPRAVSTVMLGHLSQLLDLAGRHRLEVCVSVLTGFLSGKQFIPAWAKGNLATRAADRPGELYLFKELGRVIGRHPHLLGFDVGNELVGRFVGTPAAVQQGWCDALVAAARAAAPGKLHSVSGVSKYLAGFPTILSTSGDVSVVHPWFFYPGAVDRHGLLTQAVQRHVELNVEYIKSFHDFDPASARRKVWVQEVGAPDSTIPTPLHEDFVRATMRNALSCDDLWGITWWDSHDIDTALLPQFSPPESTLGLFDATGKLKPAGQTFAAEIARWKKGLAPIPQPRQLAVTNTGPTRWEQLAAGGGARVAMVPASRARDAAYLSQRGIMKVADAS